MIDNKEQIKRDLKFTAQTKYKTLNELKEDFKKQSNLDVYVWYMTHLFGNFEKYKNFMISSFLEKEQTITKEDNQEELKQENNIKKVEDIMRENIGKKGKIINHEFIKDGKEVEIKDIVELTQQYIVTPDGSSMFYVNKDCVEVEEKKWEDIVFSYNYHKVTLYFEIKQDGIVKCTAKEYNTGEIYRYTMHICEILKEIKKDGLTNNIRLYIVKEAIQEYNNKVIEELQDCIERYTNKIDELYKMSDNLEDETCVLYEKITKGE